MTDTNGTASSNDPTVYTTATDGAEALQRMAAALGNLAALGHDIASKGGSRITVSKGDAPIGSPFSDEVLAAVHALRLGMEALAGTSGARYTEDDLSAAYAKGVNDVQAAYHHGEPELAEAVPA